MNIRNFVAGGFAWLAFALPASAQDSGSPEFFLRDLQNMEESTRRQQDMMTNPAFGQFYWPEAVEVHLDNYTEHLQHPDRQVRLNLSRILPGEAADPYRQHWGGARGIQQAIEYINPCGARISGTVFAPLRGTAGPIDPVTGQLVEPPYPGIVISTGAIDGYEELYWWAAQGLAEAGYVVMTYDVMSQGDSDETCPDGSPSTGFSGGMIDAIRWFRSDANPFHADIDETRLGIAGHSAGGGAVSDVGHRPTLPIGENGAEVSNPVLAVVGWDGISSSPFTRETDPLTPRVPTMSQNAEYFFNPVPRTSGPATSFPAWVGAFQTGEVPWMHAAFRAATHIEWTFVPYILPATRQGERKAMYYTLAWFDRWVKPADPADTNDPHVASATARLMAKSFDGSADVSSIGAGCYDPATNSNVPYTIEGECVATHMSIYNLSGYDLGDGKTSLDMRADGCDAEAPGFEGTLLCGGPLLPLY